jgi:small subunit ribosomal protein S10
MAITRIKLSGTDIGKLNEIIDAIKEISTKNGVVIRGPIPLPTKRLKVTTRKSPCGDGKASFDRFEMRIHKRLIDLPSNERVLHSIMRLPIPKDVNIEIQVLE